MVRLGRTGRLAVAALGLALAGCQAAHEDESPPAPVVSVGIDTVRRDTITAVATLVGRLGPIPGGSAVLSAPTDGIVATIAVSLGTRVSRGEVLVKLDAPDLEAQATALRAQAVAAQQDADRQRRLLDEGIASRRQVEERSAAATAASAAADAAEAMVARTRLISPIRGAVQRVLVQPGERVASGQPLIEVIDDRQLDLVAPVSAADLRRLKVGLPASVEVGDGSTARSGRIQAIAPALDSLANSTQVVVRIAQPGSGLRAGGTATAVVRLGVHRDVLVVPDSSLVLIGGQLHVFVIGSDSIARARPVEVLVRSGGRAEVSGSLESGNRVVTSGGFGLPDSVKVVPMAKDSL